MPRIVGVLTSAALALSLLCGVTLAGGLLLSRPHFDLATQVMLRLFGETADATASFSAADGDRASESPLRELALGEMPAPASNSPFSEAQPSQMAAQQHVSVASLSGAGASDFGRVDGGLTSAGVRFSTELPLPQPRNGLASVQNALYTAAYQPVAPVPSISPDPGTLAFDSAPGDSSSAAAPDLPLSLGAEGRAFKRTVSLNFSGQDQRTLANDVAGLTPATLNAPSWQLPAASATLAVPNSAGSNKLSLGAGLAFPVFHGLTLNLAYDAQRSYGGYVLPGVENLDAADNSYAGKLTYNIPYSSSSLSISAYQNRFGESVLPVNGYTQTGEDVNFTVKF